MGRVTPAVYTHHGPKSTLPSGDLTARLSVQLAAVHVPAVQNIQSCPRKVYKGVHEDGEPLRYAAMASAAVFETAS